MSEESLFIDFLMNQMNGGPGLDWAFQMFYIGDKASMLALFKQYILSRRGTAQSQLDNIQKSLQDQINQLQSELNLIDQVVGKIP